MTDPSDPEGRPLPRWLERLTLALMLASLLLLMSSLVYFIVEAMD